MGLSIYADFDDAALTRLSDLAIRYTHDRAPSDPVEEPKDEFRYPADDKDIKEPREYCTGGNLEHAVLSKFSQSEYANSTSWATAIVTAAEAAVNKDGSKNVHLSVVHLLYCLPAASGVGFSDVRFNDIFSFLSEKGLVEVDEAEQFINEDGSFDISHMCNTAEYTKTYKFSTISSEAPNRGGLINLLHEGNPVVALMAINLESFRLVTGTGRVVPYKGAYDEPTLFGVVRGYNKGEEEENEEKAYWDVVANVVPCQSVSFTLPMTDDDELGNYAGIAGYAFALNLTESWINTDERVLYVKDEQWEDQMNSGIYHLVFPESYGSSVSTFSLSITVDNYDKFKNLRKITFDRNAFINAHHAYIDVSMLSEITVIFKEGSFSNLEDSEDTGRRLASGRRLAGGKLVIKLPGSANVVFEEGSGKNFETVVVSGENTNWSVGEGSLSGVSSIEYEGDISKENAENLADLIDNANQDQEKPTVAPMPPTTEPPTTEAPTTLPPTAAPTTQAPSTEAPTMPTEEPTEAPSTAAPSTAAPSTVGPTPYSCESGAILVSALLEPNI